MDFFSILSHLTAFLVGGAAAVIAAAYFDEEDDAEADDYDIWEGDLQ